MTEEQDFAELIQRAKAGDQAAQTLICLEWCPHIERIIQYELRRFNIAWAAEADDVFDTVFVTLWRSSSLTGVDQRLHFLHYWEKAIARKVSELWRSLTAAKRDFRKSVAIDFEDPTLAHWTNAAEHEVEFKEQLAAARTQMTPTELEICQLYRDGLSWQEIADRRGRSADALRKMHQRAALRIAAWIDRQQ